MSGPALGSLMQRLDRLEGENRRLKRVGAAVAIGIAAVVLMGQARTAPRVLEAERFIARDATGKARAELAVEADGTPKLSLYDENGKQLASLNVINNTPALYLAGRDGVERAWLEVADDAPRLVFRDHRKRQRLVLGGFSLFHTTGVTEHRPTSSLVLSDEDGKVIWKAP